MSTLATVLLVLLALIVLLALGGAIANARRRSQRAGLFAQSLDDAGRQLAAAHAQDKGWEPTALDAAARASFLARRSGSTISDLALVAVLDRPGTDQDQAVFRVRDAHGEHRLTLGRRGDEWYLEDLDGF